MIIMKNYISKLKIERLQRASLHAKMPSVIVILIFAFLVIGSNDAHAGTIIKSPAYLGLQRGLVGCWSFDGSYTKAPDCSGNNNTGTLTNGPTKTTGKVGQALKFDGTDDYGTIPHSTPLEITGDLTISGWVKYNTAFGGRYCFSKGDAWNRNTPWTIGCDGAGIISFSHNNSTAGNGAEIVSPAGSIPLLVWKQFAVVRNTVASTLSMYIDGVLVAGPTAYTITPTANGKQITLAAEEALNNFSPLVFDELRIYNRALSATEVNRLYRIGLGSTANHGTSASNFDKGLVGHWTFDGPDISGTRAKDRSGNNNHGTLTNGPKQTIGKVGQALDFDGVNDYIDGTDIDFATGPFTISTWLKATSTVSGPLIHKFQDSLNQNYYIYYDGNGNVMVGLYDGSDWQEVNYNGGFNDGQWHNIVMLVTATQIGLYVDGQSRGTPDTHDNSFPTNDAVFNIGRINSGDSYFPGTIDEVRIYNRALSAAEINRLYQSTQSKYNSSQTDSLLKGLVGHWTFDGPDISGTRAKDRSGNNNHGTLTNSPTKTTGKIGQALDFDGSNDYVSLSNGSALQITNGSISVWAYQTQEDNAIEYTIFNYPRTANNTTTAYRFYKYDDADTLIFRIQDTQTATANTNSSLNKWKHYVVTWDGSNINFYENGVNIGTVVQTVTPSYSSPDPPLIGAIAGASPWMGRLDELRIYNRALSAAEIQKLYNMGH